MAKCMKCGKPIKSNRSICSFCDGHMCGYDKGRTDAIEEFLDKVKELYPNDSNALYKLMCIAGQLKEQNK